MLILIASNFVNVDFTCAKIKWIFMAIDQGNWKSQGEIEMFAKNCQSTNKVTANL